MPELSSKIADEFCGYCSWLYKVWATRRMIFDDNRRVNDMFKSNVGYYLEVLSRMSLEYGLNLLVKLHDPADQFSSNNLTIEYVLKYGDWDDQERSELTALKEKLDSFAELVKPARNKIFAHRDVDTVLANKPLGEFPKDKDVEYFEDLQKFVNIVHTKFYGCIYVLRNPYPITDAEILVNLILNDRDEREARRNAFDNRNGTVK